MIEFGGESAIYNMAALRTKNEFYYQPFQEDRLDYGACRDGAGGDRLAFDLQQLDTLGRFYEF